MSKPNKMFIDKVQCLCFDEGNNGLMIGYGFDPAVEIEESEEAILKFLNDNHVVFAAPRVLIVEAFDDSDGRRKYEVEQFNYLEAIYAYGEDRDNVFAPEIEQINILITKEKIEKLNLRTVKE
jgi:hypothetical protein